LATILISTKNFAVGSEIRKPAAILKAGRFAKQADELHCATMITQTQSLAKRSARFAGKHETKRGPERSIYAQPFGGGKS
jgi:hypothetical protein